MQAAALRCSAFGGSTMCAPSMSSRIPLGRRMTVDVRSAQPLQGTVKSVKTNKTVVVSVERLTVDEKYGKRIRKTKRYIAHDEHSKCSLGDYVRLEASRPLSAHKRFAVSEIVRSGQE